MEISPHLSSRIAPFRAKGTAAKANLPMQSLPAVSNDGYEGSVSTLASVKLPKLEEPRPEDLKRGYLWQAIPLPSPVDGILGAVLSFGPIPRMMGLEPAPKAKPEPNPLPFSWNDASPTRFGEEARHLESLLRDPAAKEVGKRRIKGGSNANYLVTLSNGASAVWTPKASEKSAKSMRANIPEGSQAKREEAAYVVDRNLGHLARVPPAVSSGMEGRPGSLKLLVSQAQDAADTGAELPFSPQDYRRIALFDHVVGNLDRHKGNFLLDAEKRPIPIDHGLAFPVKNGEQGYDNFHFDSTFQLNAEEKSLLGDFVARREQVTKDLEGLLEPEAIEAMYQRTERMLEIGWISHEWRTR